MTDHPARPDVKVWEACPECRDNECSEPCSRCIPEVMSDES